MAATFTAWVAGWCLYSKLGNEEFCLERHKKHSSGAASTYTILFYEKKEQVKVTVSSRTSLRSKYCAEGELQKQFAKDRTLA